MQVLMTANAAMLRNAPPPSLAVAQGLQLPNLSPADLPTWNHGLAQA